MIAVSHYEAGLLEDRFGISADVVPNGIDIAKLRLVTRKRANDGEVHLLVVSRLFKYKRIDAVIRALALLPETYSLVVHGDGPEAIPLSRLASRLGVQRRVCFQTSHLCETDLWRLLADGRRLSKPLRG